MVTDIEDDIEARLIHIHGRGTKEGTCRGNVDGIQRIRRRCLGDRVGTRSRATLFPFPIVDERAQRALNLVARSDIIQALEGLRILRIFGRISGPSNTCLDETSILSIHDLGISLTKGFIETAVAIANADRDVGCRLTRGTHIGEGRRRGRGWRWRRRRRRWG